ncbi:MAG TPA: hypothetical protein VGE53_02845 [Candidatus Paceibacterota bacterium]
MDTPEELDDADVSAAVASAMRDLPKPVRDFLKSDERDVVVRDLSAKYNLHVDQAGEFERAFILMLLGVERPEEFMASLSATGLTADVINGLATDLNERVFTPLRDAERLAATTPVPVPPKKPEPIPPPALDYQPAQTLPGSPVPAPMPALAVAPQAPVAQQHIVHAMPETHQAGWHPAAAVHIFVPTHQAMPQPVPVAATPVPVQPEPAPVVPAAPAPAPEVPVAAEVVVSQPPPITKSYGADPYREPI